MCFFFLIDNYNFYWPNQWTLLLLVNTGIKLKKINFRAKKSISSLNQLCSMRAIEDTSELGSSYLAENFRQVD